MRLTFNMLKVGDFIYKEVLDAHVYKIYKIEIKNMKHVWEHTSDEGNYWLPHKVLINDKTYDGHGYFYIHSFKYYGSDFCTYGGRFFATNEERVIEDIKYNIWYDKTFYGEKNTYEKMY